MANELRYSECMTREETRVARNTVALIRSMGMIARYAGDISEYRVNITRAMGGSEDTAYYTPDAMDALGTAKAMLAHVAANGGK